MFINYNYLFKRKVYFLFTIISILLLVSITCNIKVNAYQETGHPDFTSVEFYDTGELLIDISHSEIEFGEKQLNKFKFWGWKTFYFNHKKLAKYVGEVLFSKSNKTKTAYQVDYTIETTKITNHSTKINGSLSGKFSETIKKFVGTLSFEGELENKVDNKIERSEETKIKVSILPNKRVTLRITGDAYVTNGISKYYVLGMVFKKGTWESIDVLTSYYELFEEDIK